MKQLLSDFKRYLGLRFGVRQSAEFALMQRRVRRLLEKHHAAKRPQ